MLLLIKSNGLVAVFSALGFALLTRWSPSRASQERGIVGEAAKSFEITRCFQRCLRFVYVFASLK